MKPKTFYGVQANTAHGKLLCWHYKNSKSLYFTVDKKSPPPALFTSKGEAVKAMDVAKGANKKDIKPSKLFGNVIACKSSKVVKVNVSVGN